MSLPGKAIGVAIIGIAFAGAAAWAVQGGGWPGGEDRDAGKGAGQTTVAITERAFVQRVARQCHIEYGAPRALSAPADGLLELLVEDGAEVEKGQVIARYETEELESEQRRLAADIDSLNARLAFKSGPYSEQTDAIWEIERDEQGRRQSRLEQKLTEMQALEEEGQIAPQRLEETRLRLDEAEAERARLEHQRVLDQAQAELDIDQMRHDLALAEARLADIAREKERSAVQAPESGRIIWRDPLLVESGVGAVRRGAPIAALVKSDLYGAMLRIGDSDMNVVDGAAVTVRFGDERQPVAAEIVSKRLVDDPIEQKRGRYEYEVSIAFSADGHEDVLYGQAICTFTKPVGAPSPAIPASAVQFQNGRSYALRVEGGETELVELQLGEVSDGYVRVLSGLKSGDVVAE